MGVLHTCSSYFASGKDIHAESYDLCYIDTYSRQGGSLGAASIFIHGNDR